MVRIALMHLYLTDQRSVSPEKYATAECTRLLDGVYKTHNLNRLVIDEVRPINSIETGLKADIGSLHFGMGS